MTREEFERLIKNIKRGERHEISLAYLQTNMDHFEILLEVIVSKGAVDRVQLEGFFSRRQLRIMCNAYIAAIYHQLSNPKLADRVEQFRRLQEKYGIHLNNKFNFDYNVVKHDVQLQGYTAVALDNPRAVASIAQYESNAPRITLNAILRGDNAQVHQANHFGVNLNEPVDGCLPIVVACERRRFDIFLDLLSWSTDLLKVDASGICAMDRICAMQLTEFLFEALERGNYKPCNFIDDQGEILHRQQNVIKGLVDADSAVLLDKYLNRKYTVNGEYIYDTYTIKRVIAYARATGKPKVLAYAEGYIPSIKDLEARFVFSILRNDLPEFKRLLKFDVDVNTEDVPQPPLYLVCKANHPDMLDNLKDHRFSVNQRARFYKFEDYDAEGYTPALEPIYIAVTEDHVELLKYCLEDPSYFLGQRLAPGLLHRIYVLAKASASLKVLSYLGELNQQLQVAYEKLFQLVMERKYEQVTSLVQSDILNPNVTYRGRALIHVLCDDNALPTITILAQRTQMDINFPDASGKYPLTIACERGLVKLAMYLLMRPECRVYPYEATTAEGYTPMLDPVKIALDHDEADLLIALLKYAFRCREDQQKLAPPTLQNLMIWHAYAARHNRLTTMAILSSYIHIVESRQPLFDNSENLLRQISDEEQNVSRFDMSAAVSAQAIAALYGISIEPISATDPNLTLKSDKYNFDHEFAKLDQFITECSDVQYKLYKPDVSYSLVYSRTASMEEYRGWARTMFVKIRDLLPGCNGHYQHWHMRWPIIEKDGKEKFAFMGLTTKEVWALVIIAAFDKKYFISTEIEPEEREEQYKVIVKQRQDLLVFALVLCARCYNRNNPQEYDNQVVKGGESCVHGVMLRSLMAMTFMHPAINMQASPLDWAKSVAEDAVLEFLRTYEQANAVARYYALGTSQLTSLQQVVLDEFYAAVTVKVAQALTEIVGFHAKGGYLRADEFDNMLKNIRYIALPNVIHADDNPLHGVNEFTLASHCSVQCEGVEKHPYVLPPTVDSMFAAILISAQEQRLPWPEGFATVPNLRLQLSRIISYVPICTDEVDADPLPGANGSTYEVFKDFGPSQRDDFIQNTGMQLNAAFAIARQLKDEGRSQYFASLQTNAAPTLLLLQILAGTLNVTIRIYNEQGILEMDIAGQRFFNRQTNNAILHVCVCRVSDNGHISPDFLTAHPLIAAEFHAELPGLLPFIGVRTLQQQLADDRKVYRSGEIMSGRNISFARMNMWQIRMPYGEDNGDSLFIAILAAAKNMEHIQAISVDDVDMLRSILYGELTALCAQGNVLLGDLQLTPELLQLLCTANMPVHINILRALADLWNVNICIYVVGRGESIRFEVKNPQHTLYLVQIDQHFNVLLPISKLSGWKQTLLPSKTSKRKGSETSSSSSDEDVERARSRQRLG